MPEQKTISVPPFIALIFLVLFIALLFVVTSVYLQLQSKADIIILLNSNIKQQSKTISNQEKQLAYLRYIQTTQQNYHQRSVVNAKRMAKNLLAYQKLVESNIKQNQFLLTTTLGSITRTLKSFTVPTKSGLPAVRAVAAPPQTHIIFIKSTPAPTPTPTLTPRPELPVFVKVIISPPPTPTPTPTPSPTPNPCHRFLFGKVCK